MGSRKLLDPGTLLRLAALQLRTGGKAQQGLAGVDVTLCADLQNVETGLVFLQQKPDWRQQTTHVPYLQTIKINRSALLFQF
jgi:hypothetical protein